MADYDGTIRIKVEMDSSGIQDGISEIKDDVQGINDKISETNALLNDVKDTGQKALDKAIEYGAGFEDSWAGVSIKLDDTKADVDELERKILSLSTTTGIAATDMAEALSRALSSGVLEGADADAIIQFMEKVSELSIATNSKMSTATDATTGVINAYGLGLEDVTDINNVLYQVQQKSGESLDVVGNNMSTVNTTAAALGLSYEEVCAAMSTMTAQGTSSSQAATQLNALLTELSTDGSDASNSLAEATRSADGSSKSFQDLLAEGYSFTDIMGMLNDYAGKTDQTMNDLIGTQNALAAANQLGGEKLVDFKDNLTEIKTETNAVTDNAEALDNTLNSKFNKALNGGKNVLISFYNVLGPAQNALVAYRLKQVLLNKNLESLPKSTDIAKGAIKKVGEAFKTLGSKLKDVLSKIGEFSKSAVKGMGTAFSNIGVKVKDFGSTSVKGLGNSFKSMGGFFKSFGKTMGTAMLSFGPYLLIIAAVAAAAYLIYKNWDKIKPILLAIWNAIKEAALVVWGWIKEFFSTLWDGLSDIFSAVWGVISGVLSAVWDAIVLAATTIWNGLSTFFTGLWNGIQTVISTAWEVISGVLSAVWDAIVLAATTIWTGLSTFFSDLWTIITEAVTIAWTAIKEFFSELWTGISSAASTAWEGVQTVWSTVATWFTDNVINPLLTTFGNLKNGVIQIWNDIWSGIKTVINDYILWGIEAFINGIISGINSLIMVLNRLKISVPNWVTKLTGISSFGFSIKTIDAVSLPRLAQGAVIPPNRQFLAVLGDQKSGVNIETPLDTMVEAFKSAIGEMGLGGAASTDVHISYEGSLAKLAQVLQPHITAETSRRGLKAVKVGSLA